MLLRNFYERKAKNIVKKNIRAENLIIIFYDNTYF